MLRLVTLLFALLLRHEFKTLRREIWVTAESLVLLLLAICFSLAGEVS